MWLHTQAPAATLYLPPPLSYTHKQKYFMLLSQGYLFCVCVFTPLVIPVPMVSVALERRVISSFWGVAHWDPGGVQRRGERKMRKEGGLLELLELFRGAHPCTSPRNPWLHVSGVLVLLSYRYPCPFFWVSAVVHAPLFLCPFHFVLGSYHQPRLLFSSGLRLQSDAVCLCSSLLALSLLL